MTTDPFIVTINAIAYTIYPDFDDFIDKMIYGIEVNKKEIGILMFNESKKWEWIDGGIDSLSASLLGKNIEERSDLKLEENSLH